MYSYQEQPTTTGFSQGIKYQPLNPGGAVGNFLHVQAHRMVHLVYNILFVISYPTITNTHTIASHQEIVCCMTAYGCLENGSKNSRGAMLLAFSPPSGKIAESGKILHMDW